MIKITILKSQTFYKLTECERVSLASKQAIDLLNEKLKNLDNFINNDIDFFTGKNVLKCNQNSFKVNKDGKLYDCIYDREWDFLSDIEREIKYFLMWTHKEKRAHIEIIGDYIKNDKAYKAIDETGHNECVHFVKKDLAGCYEGRYEELELTEQNKAEVRNTILSF